RSRTCPKAKVLGVSGVRFSGASYRFQSRKHVIDNIVGMFEPDRHTHQSVADAELGALCWREPLVRRRCRVRDQAFRVTEIVADANELERILKTECAALAALDFKCNERRAAAHLLLHNRGLWMIR